MSYAAPNKQAIEETQAELGRPIPGPLLDSLANISRYSSWCMDSLSDDMPEAYEDVCSGNCRWDLASMVEVELDKQLFLKKKGKRLSKAARARWNGAFAFHFVIDPNGSDFIAMDASHQPQQPVVLLHGGRRPGRDGYVLAPSLDGFLESWSQLAFVELNLETLALFTNDFTTPLRADGASAKQWLAWLVK